jgi:predicted RNase H-like nuclease (RuvC/YqgF family)
MELYAEMCAQAGPIYSLKREAEIVRSQKLKIQALYEENQNLKNEIQARHCTIAQLKNQYDDLLNRLDWRLLAKIRQWPGADTIKRLLRPLLSRMLSGNEAKMNRAGPRKKKSETTNKREKTPTKNCMPAADGEKAENSLLSTT